MNVNEAKAIVTAAERAKRKLAESRNVIEEFYGLRTKDPLVYDEQRAAEVALLSPKGHVLNVIELSWDRDGNILHENVRSRNHRLEGIDELRIAIKKLKTD